MIFVARTDETWVFVYESEDTPVSVRWKSDTTAKIRLKIPIEKFRATVSLSNFF